MNLLLSHPEVAYRDCADCQRWMYDDKNGHMGQRLKARGGAEWMERPVGAPTPCWMCPKESPEHAKQIELSAKNRRTLEIYFQSKAGAMPDDWKADPILRRNLGIIENVVSQHQRDCDMALLTVSARARI